jgi:hypothetical protein
MPTVREIAALMIGLSVGLAIAIASLVAVRSSAQPNANVQDERARRENDERGEQLVAEAKAILRGRFAEWKSASIDGQLLACETLVGKTHRDETPERQKMLARLIWAQVDYTFADSLNSSFVEIASWVDAMDYQPKTPQTPQTPAGR